MKFKSFVLFAAMSCGTLLAQTEFSSSRVPNDDLFAAADSNSLSMPAAPAPQYQQSSPYSAAKGLGHSGKLALEAGGGFNAPSGNDTPYITWGGNLNLGVGWQFNSHIGALVEYQFIDDKLPGQFLSAVGTPSGNTHIWSFTLDPIIYLRPVSSQGWNLYAVGGGGFYRKVTNFNEPVPIVACNYFGFCIAGYENATVQSFSSNQGGMNIGFGLTHTISDNRARLFAEARYLWVDSPAGTSSQLGTGTTELFPVTFGIRW